jgi:flagellar hook-length control protein FliK
MSSEVKTSINKLQDNLQFMKDLNNLFLYLQLPIRFKEQDVHGDLYVFTRKNQKHYDTERLNVLLHLDMTHLGFVDIHLFMSNRQVKAIFYLEKSSEQLIAKNMHELIDVLNDKGYQLEASTQVSDSKPDFINDILQNDAPSSNTHRYSFDIRA